ncbi:hypothetical protein [Demequina aurantiaca]|uniref:hypothetical protein n=1 Tax=Demequina aurantiaca TaxID=676200 RepID=UPI003D3315E3
MDIIQRRGTYWVERKGQIWALMMAGVLFAWWMVFVLSPGLAGELSMTALVTGTVFLVIPAAALVLFPGRTCR